MPIRRDEGLAFNTVLQGGIFSTDRLPGRWEESIYTFGPSTAFAVIYRIFQHDAFTHFQLPAGEWMSSKLFANACEAGPTHCYHTDAQIVEHCLDGDQQAWGVLLEKYRKLIHSIPFKYGASPDDAADIFQTVALDLFSDLPKLREPQALRAWLIQVTMRKCLQWKEARLRRAEDDLHQVELNPPECMIVAPTLLEEAELEQQLREAVSLLPQRFRQLVRMLFFDHPPRSYKEIAESLGLARGSIPFLRARCLKRLRQILQEMEIKFPITRFR